MNFLEELFRQRRIPRLGGPEVGMNYSDTPGRAVSNEWERRRALGGARVNESTKPNVFGVDLESMGRDGPYINKIFEMLPRSVLEQLMRQDLDSRLNAIQYQNAIRQMNTGMEPRFNGDWNRLDGLQPVVTNRRM